MNFDPELIKIKTKDDEIKDLKNKTETHDHENHLKSLKIDNEKYNKSYESLKKRTVLLMITENLVGTASTVRSSTLAILKPSAGFVISSSAALSTSVAVLIANEYISELKIPYTKIGD